MANWAKYQAELVGLPVAKRAQHGIHFSRPDGLIQADFVGKPCHWLDTNNAWKEIDTALKAVGAEFGAPGLSVRIAADGSVRVNGKSHAQKSGRIGVLDTVYQSFSHIQDLGNGLVSDDKLIRSCSNYEQHLTLTEDGLRDELLVMSLPNGVGSSPTDYICVETAVSESFPDGWLDAYSADGYQFGNPSARDANGKMLPARRYAKKIGNVQYVYTGVPLAALAGAMFPVTIDPDFSVGADKQNVDGISTTYATARSTSTGQSASLYCGQQLSGANYDILRMFTSFNTASIGAGATVTQVNEKLTTHSVDYSDYDFDLQIIEYAWTSPIDAGNREAAFDNCLAQTGYILWRNTAGMATSTQYTSANMTTGYVNTTGVTYYSHRSNLDKSGTAPIGNEFILIGPSPVLTVLYSAAANAVYNFGTIIG